MINNWFDIRHVCELLLFVYLLLESWFAGKTFLSLMYVCEPEHSKLVEEFGDIPWGRKHDKYFGLINGLIILGFNKSGLGRKFP